MATPTFRSYQQVLGDICSTFLSRHGIPYLKVGGPILSLFEAFSSSLLRADQDIFRALTALDLDRAEDGVLARIGEGRGVIALPRTTASGSVSIGDSSFTKIVSTVYAGTAAPIIGSTYVYIQDGSSFPATGSVFLGRGTVNYEGPIFYTAVTNMGVYWRLTLASATTRFHNQGEGVVVAQGGDRKISSGTVVQTTLNSFQDVVSYRTTTAVTLPDGETAILGVPIVCSVSGAVGNVATASIVSFGTSPFSGAVVTNPQPLSNGRDVETNDAYRDRIRTAQSNAIGGTPDAISAAAIGVVAADEGKRVASAGFIRAVDGTASSLVVDDGSGYEQSTVGVAVEQLLDDAVGGEQDFGLRVTPCARASITAGNSAPYVLADGDVLWVVVGGITYSYTFSALDFTSISAATAYEVVDVINSDPTLGFRAYTDGGGAYVRITARAEENDTIEVVAPSGISARDANLAFVFPAGEVRTLALFKNDRLLEKDGRVASIVSHDIGVWNPLVGSQTLTVSVDGTSATTYTIADADFIAAATGFVTVGRNTPAAWAAVLNAKLPGVTAVVEGSAVRLTSNRGAVDTASLEITGGTLVSAQVFPLDVSVAASKDYVLDRSTGQGRLVVPLVAGDRLSAGANSPRAFLESAAIATPTTAAIGHLWVAPDGATNAVEHGVTSITPIKVSVAGVHDWGYRLQVEAFAGIAPTADPFGNVNQGDVAVLWDTAWNTTIRGAFRVEDTDVSALDATKTTILQFERRAAQSPRAGHALVSLIPPAPGVFCEALVCGGWVGPSPLTTTPVAITNTVERYNPNTKIWSPAAPMLTARAYHTATTLSDGRVLVVGGIGSDGVVLATAEAYTPSTDVWAAVDAYQLAVQRHTATLLATGRVLVCGGISTNVPGTGTYRTASSEFNPITNTWSANLAMGTARAYHSSVLLPTGTVLAVSGKTTAGAGTVTSEIYTTGVGWAAAGGGGALSSARASFGLALDDSIPATKVVVAVGDDRSGANTGKYAVYTIATDTWGADTAFAGAVTGVTVKNCNNQVVRTASGNVLIAYAEKGGVPVTVVGNTSGTSWWLEDPPMYADAPHLEEACVTMIQDVGLVDDLFLSVGGLNPTLRQPTAVVEYFDLGTGAWTQPDAAAVTGLTLPQTGISFVQTTAFPQDVSIPIGVSYTATSFATAITPVGATAGTWRTNRLRLRTNTHGTDGDIALIAVDNAATATGLTAGVETNLLGRVGSVESLSEQGTPLFEGVRILEEGKATGTGVASLVRMNTLSATGGHRINELRVHDDGSFAAPNQRYGRSKDYATSTVSVRAETQANLLALRTTPPGGYAPYDRAWLAAPFCFDVSDRLAVTVDGNSSTRRYDIPMTRKLSPVGAAYSTSCAYLDADNSDASLAIGFGYTYDYNDFAVLMKARGKAYSADATRSMLARYYRPGEIGERCKARISYPLAASTDVRVDLDATSSIYSYVRARMGGGAARSLTSVRGTAKIGTACTSVTTGLGTIYYIFNLAITAAARDILNETTLTLALPAGTTDCGFSIGNTLWLQSSNPAWLSGQVSVTNVGAAGGPTQTIKFTNAALGIGIAAGGAIGTVSADSQGECTLTGGAVIAGDYVRAEVGSSIPASYTGETFRIGTVAAGYVQTVAAEKTFAGASTVINWGAVGSISNFSIFQSLGDTVTAFVAKVNALVAVTNTTVPVTLTVLGTGAGILGNGTVEDLGTSTSWISLEDGRNWVGLTTAPAPGGNYTLTFKENVSANLAADSDWANEDVWILPATAKNVADWLATPCVSGLFSSAEVALISSGKKVQISTLTAGTSGSVQVQGGTANEASSIVLGSATDVAAETYVSMDADDAARLPADGWVTIENTSSATKNGVFTAATVLSSWTSAGVATFTTPVYTARFAHTRVRMQWDRQGRYIAISDPTGLNAGSVTLAGLQVGDWLRVKAATAPTSFAQVSATNIGIYPVVAVDLTGEVYSEGGTIWIEAPDAVEEVTECDLQGYSYDSVMPGDTISISHDVWGASNIGTWDVTDVGTAFTSTTKLTLTSANTPVPVTAPTAALGTTNVKLTQVLEGTPSSMVAKITSIEHDSTDGAYSLVKLTPNTMSRLINQTNGSVLYAADKLGYPTTLQQGVDGYRVGVGLIGETNRVIFGDSSDPITYPGVVALGAKVVVEPPQVRRITIALQIRTSLGYHQTDIASRVRSAVAAEINQIGVGQPVSFSGIIQAASTVQGVVAVTILSPTYDSIHDVITLTSAEKPMVLDLDNDVSVSFVAG